MNPSASRGSWETPSPKGLTPVMGLTETSAEGRTKGVRESTDLTVQTPRRETPVEQETEREGNRYTG